MGKGISPRAAGVTLAATTAAMDILGYVWHGLLRQPSVVNLIYPGFWGNPTLMFYGLAGTVALGYVFGALAARVYNWAEKEFG